MLYQRSHFLLQDGHKYWQFGFKIRELMDKPTNIRNMSVIAHGIYAHHLCINEARTNLMQSTTENLHSPIP